MNMNSMNRKTVDAPKKTSVNMSKEESTRVGGKYEIVCQALQVPEIAAGLSMRVLALMKEKYVEIGICNFPCLVYFGRPGCGKTRMAYALLEDSGLKLNAWDNQTKRRDWLQNIMPGQLVLVDDVNGAKGGRFSTRIRDNVNQIIREMYSGELPVGIFTMETNALTILNDSAKSRMIFCEMSDFLKSEEKAGIVRKLDGLTGKHLMNDLFMDFKVWLTGRCTVEWLSGKWEEYEDSVKQHGEIKRFLDEQMQIKLALSLFCEYLHIEEKRIISAVSSQVLQKKLPALLSRSELLEIVYGKALKAMGNRLMIPQKGQVCTKLWDGVCCFSWSDRYRQECFGKGEPCDEGHEHTIGYVPTACILRENQFVGVLLEDLGYLLCVPAHFVGERVLVVNFELMLSNMNEQLQDFCSKNKLAGQMRFSANEFKKFLFKTNRCLFEQRTDAKSKKKNRVQFSYLVGTEYQDEVDTADIQNGYLWLRVEQEIFEDLKRVATIVRNPVRGEDRALDHEFVRMIKRQISCMSFGLGTIGNPDECLLKGTDYTFEE